jgi:hypothetical protein
MTQKESPATKAQGLGKLNLWALKSNWMDIPLPSLSWETFLDGSCGNLED